MDKDLDILVHHLNEEVTRGGFTRLEPTPVAPEIEIAAAWKQKSWGHVWGIAAVSLGRFTNDPGDFAHCIKRRVARAIGYFFLFHRVTLHLTIFGRGILARTQELHAQMNAPPGPVRLSSIHVVDLDAGQALRDLPEDEYVHEEIAPASTSAATLVAGLFVPMAREFQSLPARLRFVSCRKTGRAARSVSFPGGSAAECAALLNRAVDAFVYGFPVQQGSAG
jgi:hypothetical protein